jgi:hypothetical protein
MGCIWDAAGSTLDLDQLIRPHGDVPSHTHSTPDFSLGRSLQDLVGFLSEPHALRIDLFLHQQGLDTTTPGGEVMFQMMGVFPNSNAR